MYNAATIVLIKKISEQEYEVDDLLKTITEIYEQIGPIFNIGKIEIDIKSKVDMFSNNVKTINKVIYESDKYTDDIFICHESIHNSANYEIKYYSRTKFNEVEKDYIKLHNDVIAKLVARMHLIDVVHESAFIDELTGHANMAGFNRKLAKLKEEEKLNEYSMLYINIIDCKSINEKCGGLKTGNIILKAYINVINSYLNEDELVSRLGGDNFGILVKKNRCSKIIEKLNNIHVEKEINGKKYNFDIKCSIGMYRIKSTDSVMRVMENATTANNIVKKSSGINFLIFDSDVRNKIEATKKIKKRFFKSY